MHFKMKIDPFTREWDMCISVPRCYDDDLNQYLADSESSDNEYRPTYDIESPSKSSCWLATSANVVYNCGDCQKDFKYRHELKMHARKHSRLHTVYVKNLKVPFRKFKKRIKREPISSSDSESSEPPPKRKRKPRSIGKVPRNLFNSYPEKAMFHLEKTPQITPVAVKNELKLKTPVEISGTPGSINLGDISKPSERENVPFPVKVAPFSRVIKSDVEKDKRYKCRVCYRRFFTRGALIIHGRQHDHLRTKKCNICGKTFIKADCLKNHVNRHKKLGFYRKVDFPETQKKESECINMEQTAVPDIELETNQELEKPDQEHPFSRVSKMPYNCRVCHTSFAFRGDLVKHGSVHDDLRCMKCHICGKTFVMKDSLKSHINRHRSPFSEVSNSNSAHTKKEPIIKRAKTKYIQCEVCGKKISNIGNLHKHVTRMHLDTFLYKCDYCRARFQKTIDLDKHLERHQKRRPYKCDNCCKLFATSIELHVHFKRTHTDENMLTFHCDKCSKRCATSEELAKHARVHEGLKPHKCGLCSKAFRTISGRDAHAWECYGIISMCR